MPWYIVFIALLSAYGGLDLAGEREVRMAYRKYPVEGRLVPVDGGQAHVRIRGPKHGRPVVVLHGIGGSSKSVDDYLSYALAALGYRVYAPDRPGHAHSDRTKPEQADPRGQAQWLHDLIAALELEHPHIVGISWGGSVAMAYSLLYPDDIRAVALISPYVLPNTRLVDVAFTVGHWGTVSDVLYKAVAVHARDGIKPVMVKRAFHPDPIPEGYIGRIPTLLETPQGMRIGAADMRRINPALRAMYPRYAELQPPVFMILADSDQLVPFHPNKALADSLHWPVKVFEHAGHAVQISRPEQVSDELHRFFRSLE
jgi:pimeloyl-ACP methyl ester carboxylesterase